MISKPDPEMWLNRWSLAVFPWVQFEWEAWDVAWGELPTIPV